VLKYVGWSLNDKNAEVRRIALQALLKLVGDDEAFPQMSSFLDRFKVRLLAFIQNKEFIVSRSACF